MVKAATGSKASQTKSAATQAKEKSMSIQSSSSSSEQSKLRQNAIGLPGVLFQSITTMAPASAVAFSLGAAIPFAGGALPLAVIIALVVCSDRLKHWLA